MEKNVTYWYAMSDPAILEMIGNFIHETRIRQNKTQLDVSIISGVDRSTLVQIEKGGGCTLQTFIRILRALEQLHLFQNFEIKQQISPLQLAKLEQKKRQRVRKKGAGPEKPKSDW